MTILKMPFTMTFLQIHFYILSSPDPKT